MISNNINFTKNILNTLFIGTINGLILIKGNQVKRVLDNVNIKDIFVVNVQDSNIEFIVQSNNSFHKITYNETNFTTFENLIYVNDKKITSSFIQGNLIYFGQINNDTKMVLNTLNYSTGNNQKKYFTDTYNSILKINLINTNLLLVTKKSLIEYNSNLDVVISTTIIPYTPTSLLKNGSNFLVGTNEGQLIEYDNNLNEISIENFSSLVNDIFEINSDLYVSTKTGLYLNNTLINNLYTENINFNNGNIYQNISTKVVDLNGETIFEEAFNRDNIPNYPIGEYTSKPINIPLNTSLAGFTWVNSGPSGNYETGLATSQSTNNTAFSDFTNYNTANVGTYVVGITPLTQSIKYRIQISVIDSLLPSPTLSYLSLNTSTLPVEEIEPYQLKKSESLVVHSSYPQKFFDNSQIITRHDNTFKKNFSVDTDNLTQFDNTPYGFNYEIKSQTKDQFARYSKESFNPLNVNYTKQNFPLTAAPVKNVSFTVLNPEEIFLSWDPVTELLDGTLIPGSVTTRYKILRKSDSNDIYKVIYADGLISLNKTYVYSIDPITNDIGQLVDGIIEPTHFEQDSVLEFDDDVEITMNLDVAYNIDKIILSFMKEYEPEQIKLQVLNGSLESDEYIFNKSNFSNLDELNTTCLVISDIGLSGDKIKVSYTKQENNNNIKILEHEIYKGLSSNTVQTFYRDDDVDFQNGSQYYYRVVAELNQVVKPTEYVKETRIIQLGDSQAILGTIDSGNLICKISLDNSNIGTISRTGFFPQKLQGASAVTSGPYLITTGGMLENNQANLCIESTYLSNSVGELNFSQRIGMRSNKVFHTSLIKNNYLFTFGGIFDNFNKLTTNEILRSSISPNLNTLDLFDSVATLPIPCYGHNTFINNDILYILGGITDNDQYLDQSYGSNYNLSNNFDPWFVNSSLPEPLAFFNVQIYNNEIFIFGGKTKINDQVIIKPDILKATFIGGQISSWTKIGDLLKPIYGASSFIEDNKVFIVGGITTSEVLSNDIMIIELDNNGLIQSQTYNNKQLPYTTAHCATTRINNDIYLITGATNNGVSLGQTIEI